MQENYFMGKDGFYWFFGRVVEKNSDPLQLGRVKVRVFGLHTDADNLIQDEHLPWAIPIMPVTSAGIFGIGQTPTGLVVGSHVFGFFADGKEAQIPIIIGSIAGSFGHQIIASIDTIKKAEEAFAQQEQTNALYTEVQKLPEASGVAPASGYTKGRIGQILDLIALYESRGNYNAVFSSPQNPNLTNMTISEVIAYGSKIKAKTGGTPLGRYQIVQGTLQGILKSAGVSLNDKFSPEIQDKLCVQIMKSAGADPNMFLMGSVSPEKCVSKWANQWSTWPTSPNNKNIVGNESAWQWNDIVNKLNIILKGKA